MVSDLSEWSESVTEKEKNLKKTGGSGQAKSKAASGGSKPLPPIRNRINIADSLKKSEAQAPAGQGAKKPKQSAFKEELAN